MHAGVRQGLARDIRQTAQGFAVAKAQIAHVQHLLVVAAAMHTSTAHATTITALQQGKRPKRKNLLPAAAVASKTPMRQKTATKAAGTLIMTTTTATTITVTVTHTALAAMTIAPPCKSSIAHKHLLLGNGFASWRWIAP